MLNNFLIFSISLTTSTIITLFVIWLDRNNKKNKLLSAQKVQRSHILYRKIQDMIVDFDKDCLYPEDRFEFLWNYIFQFDVKYSNSELTELLIESWRCKYKEIFRKRESNISIEYTNSPIR